MVFAITADVVIAATVPMSPTMRLRSHAHRAEDTSSSDVGAVSVAQTKTVAPPPQTSRPSALPSTPPMRSAGIFGVAADDNYRGQVAVEPPRRCQSDSALPTVADIERHARAALDAAVGVSKSPQQEAVVPDTTNHTNAQTDGAHHVQRNGSASAVTAMAVDAGLDAEATKLFGTAFQRTPLDDFFTSPTWTEIDPSPALTDSLTFDGGSSCGPTPLLGDNLDGDDVLAGVPLFGDFSDLGLESTDATKDSQKSSATATLPPPLTTQVEGVSDPSLPEPRTASQTQFLVALDRALAATEAPPLASSNDPPVGVCIDDAGILPPPPLVSAPDDHVLRTASPLDLSTPTRTHSPPETTAHADGVAAPLPDAAPSRRRSSAKRRAATAELLPMDAPIRPRKYFVKSATSRIDAFPEEKEGEVEQKNGEDEDEDEDEDGEEGQQQIRNEGGGSVAELEAGGGGANDGGGGSRRVSVTTSTTSTDATSATAAHKRRHGKDPDAKRLSNTLAARRSRHRKAEELRALHATIDSLRAEVESWKRRAWEAEQRLLGVVPATSAGESNVL